MFIKLATNIIRSNKMMLYSLRTNLFNNNAKFFPYWRSVLQAWDFLRVYPSYATADASRPTVPTPVPGHKLPSLGKAQQRLSNRQSRRLFGTDASAARSALGYEELRCPRGSSMDRTPSQNHNLSLLEELHKQQIIMVNLEDSLVLLRPSS